MHAARVHFASVLREYSKRHALSLPPLTFSIQLSVRDLRVCVVCACVCVSCYVRKREYISLDIKKFVRNFKVFSSNGPLRWLMHKFQCSHIVDEDISTWENVRRMLSRRITFVVHRNISSHLNRRFEPLASARETLKCTQTIFIHSSARRFEGFYEWPWLYGRRSSDYCGCIAVQRLVSLNNAVRWWQHWLIWPRWTWTDSNRSNHIEIGKRRWSIGPADTCWVVSHRKIPFERTLRVSCYVSVMRACPFRITAMVSKSLKNVHFNVWR